MIVIFEGPDGSGKSTLAREVQRLVPTARYLHASAPERHPLVEYTSPIRAGKDYVLDRWHVGEQIYGPRYRGACGYTIEQGWAIEQYLDELGAIIIHCSGRVNELADRIRARGLKEDENLNVTQLREEATAFDRVLRNSWLPVFNSPIGVPLTAEEIVAIATDHMKERSCTS